MGAAQKILEPLENVENSVNACVDVETGLSSEERLARAHGLGISALFGDTIYNFGELVCYRRASLPLTTIEFTPQPDSMNG